MADYLAALGLGSSDEDEKLFNLDVSLEGASKTAKANAAKTKADIEAGLAVPTPLKVSKSSLFQDDLTLNAVDAGKFDITVNPWGNGSYDEESLNEPRLIEQNKRRVQTAASRQVSSNLAELTNVLNPTKVTNGDNIDVDALIATIQDTNTGSRTSTTNSVASKSMKFNAAASFYARQKELQDALNKVDNVTMATPDGRDLRETWLKSVAEVEQETEAYQNDTFGQIVTGFLQGFRGIDVSGIFTQRLRAAKDKEATLRAAVSNQFSTTTNAMQVLNAIQNDVITTHASMVGSSDPRSADALEGKKVYARALAELANKGELQGIKLTPENISGLADAVIANISNPNSHPDFRGLALQVANHLKNETATTQLESAAPFSSLREVAATASIGSPAQERAMQITTNALNAYSKTLNKEGQTNLALRWNSGNKEQLSSLYSEMDNFIIARNQGIKQEGFGAIMASGELSVKPPTVFYSERKIDENYAANIPPMLKTYLDANYLMDAKGTEAWTNRLISDMSTQLSKTPVSPQELDKMATVISDMYSDMHKQLIQVNKDISYANLEQPLKFKLTNLPHLPYGSTVIPDMSNVAHVKGLLVGANRQTILGATVNR